MKYKHTNTAPTIQVLIDSKKNRYELVAGRSITLDEKIEQNMISVEKVIEDKKYKGGDK